MQYSNHTYMFLPKLNINGKWHSW